MSRVWCVRATDDLNECGPTRRSGRDSAEPPPEHERGHTRGADEGDEAESPLAGRGLLGEGVHGVAEVLAGLLDVSLDLAHDVAPCRAAATSALTLSTRSRGASPTRLTRVLPIRAATLVSTKRPPP